MKHYYLIISIALLFITACGSRNKNAGNFPENFDKIGDIGRVQYVMQNTDTDSLARFLINTTLGLNPGVRMDTLSNAVIYVYDHLRDEDLDNFSMQFDSYVESLPLADKMKIYTQAAIDDPLKLGYKLGLEYLGSIRDENKSVNVVEKELKDFKKACATDTATYRRFIIGFRTALSVDSGKDVSSEIYHRFINYE